LSASKSPNPRGIGIKTIPPAGTDFSWRKDAACASEGSRLFFPPEEGDEDYSPNNVRQGIATTRRFRQAVVICDVCPVREKCLEYALSVPEHAGVWGGMSPDQRKQYKSQRRKLAASTSKEGVELSA
jgi:WhiB family redox-sensing transcriptional regulator